MHVAGCASANLHYSSLPEAIGLEEMVVRNISGTLDFDVYITSRRMKLLKLSNIGRIPLIARHLFVVLRTVDVLEIENVRVDYVQQEFSYVNISSLLVANVTIERTDLLNLSGNTSLTIIRSELRRVATSLNLAKFRDIRIIGSRFALERPGMVYVQGERVLVEDSVFLNASMSLVAKYIEVRGICADGRSALRLSSRYIDSTDNRLPNEIVYSTTGRLGSPEYFVERNTVCKAGNCECTKNSGQDTRRACVFVLGGLLVALFMSRGFYYGRL